MVHIAVVEDFPFGDHGAAEGPLGWDDIQVYIQNRQRQDPNLAFLIRCYWSMIAESRRTMAPDTGIFDQCTKSWRSTSLKMPQENEQPEAEQPGDVPVDHAERVQRFLEWLRPQTAGEEAEVVHDLLTCISAIKEYEDSVLKVVEEKTLKELVERGKGEFSLACFRAMQTAEQIQKDKGGHNLTVDQIAALAMYTFEFFGRDVYSSMNRIIGEICNKSEDSTDAEHAAWRPFIRLFLSAAVHSVDGQAAAALSLDNFINGPRMEILAFKCSDSLFVYYGLHGYLAQLLHVSGAFFIFAGFCIGAAIDWVRCCNMLSKMLDKDERDTPEVFHGPLMMLLFPATAMSYLVGLVTYFAHTRVSRRIKEWVHAGQGLVGSFVVGELAIYAGGALVGCALIQVVALIVAIIGEFVAIAVVIVLLVVFFGWAVQIGASWVLMLVNDVEEKNVPGQLAHGFFKARRERRIIDLAAIQAALLLLLKLVDLMTVAGSSGMRYMVRVSEEKAACELQVADALMPREAAGLQQEASPAGSRTLAYASTSVCARPTCSETRLYGHVGERLSYKTRFCYHPEVVDILGLSPHAGELSKTDMEMIMEKDMISLAVEFWMSLKGCVHCDLKMEKLVAKVSDLLPRADGTLTGDDSDELSFWDDLIIFYITGGKQIAPSEEVQTSAWTPKFAAPEVRANGGSQQTIKSDMHAWAATIRAVASRDEPVPEHLESLHANGGRLQIVRSDVLSWEATSAQLQPPLLAACGTKVYAEPEAYDGNFTVNELDPEGKLQGTQPGPSIEVNNHWLIEDSLNARRNLGHKCGCSTDTVGERLSYKTRFCYHPEATPGDTCHVRMYLLSGRACETSCSAKATGWDLKKSCNEQLGLNCLFSGELALLHGSWNVADETNVGDIAAAAADTVELQVLRMSLPQMELEHQIPALSVYWYDLEVARSAVRYKGMWLEKCAEELRGNREVVVAAVLQNGLALQFASEELRDDVSILILAADHEEEEEETVLNMATPRAKATYLAWPVSEDCPGKLMA